MIFVVAFGALLVAASLCACRMGGAAERRVAVAFIAAWAVSMAFTYFGNPPVERFHSPWLPIVMVDTVLTIILAATAMRFRRYWLIPATALQIVLVVAHAVRIFDPGFWPLSYAVMTWSWPFIQVLLLLVASAMARSPRPISLRNG